MPTVNYEDLVEKLRRRFGSRDQQEKFRVEIRYRKRRSNESLQELAQDIERLVRLAYPGADQNIIEVLGRDAFIDSLSNPALEYKVREKEPQSLTQAVTLAMKLEVLHKAREVEKEATRPRFARGATNVELPSSHNGGVGNTKNKSDYDRKSNSFVGQKFTGHQPDKDKKVTDLEQKVQLLTEKLRQFEVMTQQPQQVAVSPQPPSYQLLSPGQRQTDHPNWYSQHGAQSPFPNPYGQPRQQSPGYTTQTAPPQIRYRNAGAMGRNSPPTASNYNCYGCGEAGHIRRNCPYNVGTPRPEPQSGGGQPDTPVKARGAAEQNGRAGLI